MCVGDSKESFFVIKPNDLCVKKGPPASGRHASWKLEVQIVVLSQMY